MGQPAEDGEATRRGHEARPQRRGCQARPPGEATNLCAQDATAQLKPKGGTHACGLPDFSKHVQKATVQLKPKGSSYAAGIPDYSKQPLRTERHGPGKAERRHPRMRPPRLFKATCAHRTLRLS